jgi:hypothetical protein
MYKLFLCTVHIDLVNDDISDHELQAVRKFTTFDEKVSTHCTCPVMLHRSPLSRPPQGSAPQGLWWGLLLLLLWGQRLLLQRHLYSSNSRCSDSSSQHSMFSKSADTCAAYLSTTARIDLRHNGATL